MYKQMSEMMYYYIIKAEMVFLRIYKVDPFQLIKNISLLDLNTYLKTLQTEDEKEKKKFGGSKHVMQCLKGVNDYLNLMFYKK